MFKCYATNILSKWLPPNTREKAMDFEERIRVLLECPVCIEPLLSVPVHQCINGHVVCNGCIAKLNNCPICRNDSTLIRNLILEEIMEKILVPQFISLVTFATVMKNIHNACFK